MSADSPPPPDVAALTERMAQGDEAAWSEFYHGYFNRLLRYLLVVTNGREEAARDALQATLVRAVRHMRPFQSEETFWSWLTVLARSSAVDERRKRTRYMALLDRFFDRHEITPIRAEAELDADARLIALLEKNLQALSSDERQLVERKYFAHARVKEIAAASGATEKAIESRLSRIRQRLKELIMAELKAEVRDET